MRLPIYVVQHDNHVIAPKSAIVGLPGASPVTDHMLVYYEGNLIGAENLNTFEAKCVQAAGRAVKNYPTVAKSAFHLTELIQVGVFCTETWKIVEVFEPELLTKYSGENFLDW